MNSQTIESVFRYCPRCAAKSDQSGAIPFRCAECGFTCFFGPVAAVGGLVTDDQAQLLLIRRAKDPGKGLWGLPGGFVDRDETVEEALAREVLEETGLKITACKLMMTCPNQYNYRGVVAPVIDLFYRCEVASPHEISLADEEVDDHQWVEPAAEHLDRMAFPSNRIAVEHWMSSRGGE